MTLVMSTLANLCIYVCLVYLLGLQPGVASVTMLAIAVIVIFPVTHYKLPFFQMKHGKTIIPNSLFWCGVTVSVLACVWVFIYLLDTLMASGFDLEKVGLVLIFAPFILMFGVALYMSATGKGSVGSGNRTRSRGNRHSNSSSFGSSSSSRSISSFKSGGGRFGGGGSSGSW